MELIPHIVDILFKFIFLTILFDPVKWYYSYNFLNFILSKMVPYLHKQSYSVVMNSSKSLYVIVSENKFRKNRYLSSKLQHVNIPFVYNNFITLLSIHVYFLSTWPKR